MADHRPPRPEFHDLELSALRSGHLTSWQEWQSWQERMAADPARAGEYLDFLLPHGMAVRITGLMGPLSRLNGQSARVLALHGVRVNVQLCADAGTRVKSASRPDALLAGRPSFCNRSFNPPKSHTRATQAKQARRTTPL